MEISLGGQCLYLLSDTEKSHKKGENLSSEPFTAGALYIDVRLHLHFSPHSKMKNIIPWNIIYQVLFALR